jgi:hypothetical protein
MHWLHPPAKFHRWLYHYKDLLEKHTSRSDHPTDHGLPNCTHLVLVLLVWWQQVWDWAWQAGEGAGVGIACGWPGAESQVGHKGVWL